MSTFQQYSRTVASDFLQTVVVVDDKASTNTRPPLASVISLNAPVGRGTRRFDTPTSVQEDAAAPPSSTQQLPQDETLYIKNLNESFAEQGIICGILNPLSSGKDRKKIVAAAEQAARRADIVVLDWKMEGEGDEGNTALQIITAIFRSDAPEESKSYQDSGRLRLIAIYSQNPALASIIDKIHTLPFLVDFERVDGFTIAKDSVRICAFKKPGGLDVREAPGMEGRVLNEEELTSKLIDEFSSLTQGLLANSAILSLTAIRQNTHQILRKFNRSLDPSYLIHRALTNPVDETESHPIALISSEIHDVLAGKNVSKSVESSRIKEWLAAQWTTLSLAGRLGSLPHDEAVKSLTDLIVNGIDEELKKRTHSAEWKAFIERFQKSAPDRASELTALLLPTADKTSKERDFEFSMLTTIRTHYDMPPPQLSLGSIVAITSADSKIAYYVCIQPLCDCIRLKSVRRFPFLRLTAEKSIFDLVVHTGTAHQGLQIKYKAADMELFSFTPVGGAIYAVKETTSWVFNAEDLAGNKMQFTWLADLKFPHAQRIAALFAATISRVGLTESEWLRRMALKS